MKLIMTTTVNLNQQVQQLISNDFVSNFTTSLNARDRWNFLTHFFDVSSHLLIGATVILSFISGGLHIPFLALVAGALGTGSQVANQYSNYSYQQYKLQSQLIAEMSTKVNANDELVDETPIVSTNSPLIPPVPTNSPLIPPTNTPTVHPI